MDLLYRVTLKPLSDQLGLLVAKVCECSIIILRLVHEILTMSNQIQIAYPQSLPSKLGTNNVSKLTNFTLLKKLA